VGGPRKRGMLRYPQAESSFGDRVTEGVGQKDKSPIRAWYGGGSSKRNLFFYHVSARVRGGGGE